MQKVPRPKNECGTKTTDEHYKHIRNECEDFVQHNVDVTTVDEIFKNLDVTKALGIDIAIYFANIINLSIKLDTFLSKCKIGKIKPLFNKGIKTEVKN